MRFNALLIILTGIGLAACGGSNNSTQPTTAIKASAKPVVAVNIVAPPLAVTPQIAPASTIAPVATSSPYQFYRLGGANSIATALLDNEALGINGQRYAGVNLTPGNCSASSGNLTQCRSTASMKAFTLCGIDQGTNKSSSLYVLFDPSAVPITDTTALRNISFSGHEDCGDGNVGAQPKSAPSAKLSFDKDGNLSLTRYDVDPPKTTHLPSYFVNLSGDTTNNGVTARFTLYRLNGRYLIVATGIPSSGATQSNPGSLTAFYQD